MKHFIAAPTLLDDRHVSLLRTQEYYSPERYHRKDMFLSLQPGIRKGDPRSVEVGVKVLAHKAEINGYKAPAKVEMTGKQGGPLAIETFRKLCEEVEGEEVEDKDSSDRTKTK